MRANYIFILICIFHIFPEQADCQSTVTYLGIEQGLSNNSVRSIYQDHKGFMWFGTFDGLNRYDGYEFKIFRNKFGDPNTLVSNIVSTITEDRNNNIWLGTRQGISVYNPLKGRFTTVPWLSAKHGRLQRLDDVIKDIKTDKFNNILVAAEISGLLICYNASLIARFIPLREMNGALIYQYGVQVINVDDPKRVLVFVQGKGLFRLDYTDMLLKMVTAEVKSANCLLPDGDSVWIGTVDGLYSYNNKRNSCRKILSTGQGVLSSNFVTAVKLDAGKRLWIGTNGKGINIWDIAGKKITHLVSGDGRQSLTSNVIYPIYIDKQQRIWIGTFRGGINIIDPKKERFHTISHEPGNASSLSGNFISAFYEAGDGRLWVGTEGHGVNVLQRNPASLSQYIKMNDVAPGLAGENITGITGDSLNNIWICTFANGICRFNTVTGVIESYKTINDKKGVENKVVFYTYKDRANAIWATAVRQGNVFGALYNFNYRLDKFELFDDRLSDLFTLKEDGQGNLWGGNLTQLVKIDRKYKQHLFYNIGQPVRAIQEDRMGNLWLGTEGGGLVLFNRKEGKIAQRFTTNEGLCNNAVLSILDDNKEILWMGTYNGLSAFNTKKQTFKNFNQSDGLQSNQFHYNSAIKLGSGAFVFGGIKGFNIFFPEDIGNDKMSPPPVISDLSIDGELLDHRLSLISRSENNEIRELSIPYSKASITVSFVSLEYSSPSNISYSYYLEGWDKKWITAGNIRTASYSNLREGSYTFRVKSTNTEGLWNPTEIALQIIILPPWYRTWWAYLFYAGIVFTLIYFYVLYKDRQTRLQYEVKLAHLQTDKEREINEKKLSFFTNISHEFRTPLTLIINPIKEMLQKKSASKKEGDNDLGTVYRNAKRLLGLVDQLLLFRKTESGADNMKVTKLNFHHLCHEVFLCFVQQASAREIEYNFVSSNESLELYVDREKMEIILYNLVSNALKYTPAKGRITISIIEGEKWVEVLVKDNGLGIPADIGNDVFGKFYQADKKNARKNNGFGIGLYLVKHFTSQHMGAITFKSEPGTGTIFNLRLQKGKAHFDPAMITENIIGAPAFSAATPLEDSLYEIEDASSENGKQLNEVVSENQTILIVDDDHELRKYIAELFKMEFTVYECSNGEKGLKMAREFQPDIIISDIKMQGLSGIDLCKSVKEDDSLKHIPVILITGTSSEEIKLEGIKGGADDYITKPFENELLKARVANLLKNRSNLQQYFYNEITLNKHSVKISGQYKAFLEACIVVVEENLEEDHFNINVMATKMGMSRSVMFRKIKTISGQSPNSFIRYIRLRKAARLFIDTNANVGEVASSVGINDIKYFREHFNKLFKMNPSEYIKKYRSLFAGKFSVRKEGLPETGNTDEPENS